MVNYPIKVYDATLHKTFIFYCISANYPRPLMVWRVGSSSEIFHSL
jgi:hypothetical protein